MYNARMGVEYSVKRSSWLSRAIAWKEDMAVADFIIPTDNPYLAPTERYTVFCKGDPAGQTVLTRIQSRCVLGRYANDCDCQNQLMESFRRIREEKNGLFIQGMDDHGKGVGFVNHFRTLAVEKLRGFNEDEVRDRLGLRDARDYKPAIVILDHFGVRSVRLLTNNASKLAVFREYSIPAEQVRLSHSG